MKKQIEIRNVFGKKISLRKLKKVNKENLLTYAISKKQLLSDGILTRYKLQKLVKLGELHKILFANEIYFERNEVFGCLKNKNKTDNRLF